MFSISKNVFTNLKSFQKTPKIVTFLGRLKYGLLNFYRLFYTKWSPKSLMRQEAPVINNSIKLNY